MQKASVKVEGGKMVNLELEISNEEVKEVRIRGDFFLEPPEKLEELENRIEGLKTGSTAEEVSEELKDVEADLIGFSHEDIGEAFRKALDGDKQ
jgi:hypothetical protein